MVGPLLCTLNPVGDMPVNVVDEDLDDEDPEAVHDLHDRLIEIRRALDNLGGVTTELAAVRGRTEAQRILTDLLDEIASQHPD
jgi:hypothetical protein